MEEACFVCLERSGRLVRPCACNTRVHEACLLRTIDRVPLYASGTCPHCHTPFPLHTRRMAHLVVDGRASSIIFGALHVTSSIVTILSFAFILVYLAVPMRPVVVHVFFWVCVAIIGVTTMIACLFNALFLSAFCCIRRVHRAHFGFETAL